MAGIGCDEDRCATRRARARARHLPTLLAGYNVTLTKNTEDKEKIASSSLDRIYRYRGIDQFERVSPLCSRPSPDFLPEGSRPVATRPFLIHVERSSSWGRAESRQLGVGRA